MTFLRISAAFAAAILATTGCGGDDGRGGGGDDAGGGRMDSGGGGGDAGGGGDDAGGGGDDAGGGGDDAGGGGDDAGGGGDAGRDLSCGGKRPPGGPSGICLPTEFCSYALEDMCGAADATGICTVRPMGCTRELDPVCGCDGMDYGNPCLANAAGTSVARRGTCDAPPPPVDGRNCDPRSPACDSLPGPCPVGEVREVRGLCWGDCVPIGDCYCDEPMDCPMSPETYTCHMSAMRCGPFVGL